MGDNHMPRRWRRTKIETLASATTDYGWVIAFTGGGGRWVDVDYRQDDDTDGFWTTFGSLLPEQLVELGNRLIAVGNELDRRYPEEES